MNFKTKAVALLAGSALALSVASGAMAADNTTVTLGDNADWSCTASVSSGNINLGTLTWDGTKFSNTNATPAGDLVIQVNQNKSATENVDCTVTTEVGDLTHTTESTAKITSTNATITVTPKSPATTFIVDTAPNPTGSTLGVEATISDVTEALPTGQYSGNITADSSTSSN